MTTVNYVKSARKARPEADIAVGDSYYWWSFRYAGPYYSKIRPSRSQTTSSPFLSELYTLEDGYEFDREDLESSVDSFCDNIQNLIDQCQESLDNMPEQLQESSSAGQLLQERIDNLESWMSDLQSVDLHIDEELSEEEREEQITNIIDELKGLSSGL